MAEQIFIRDEGRGTRERAQLVVTKYDNAGLGLGDEERAVCLALRNPTFFSF